MIVWNPQWINNRKVLNIDRTGTIITTSSINMLLIFSWTALTYGIATRVQYSANIIKRTNGFLRIHVVKLCFYFNQDISDCQLSIHSLFSSFRYSRSVQWLAEISKLHYLDCIHSSGNIQNYRNEEDTSHFNAVADKTGGWWALFAPPPRAILSIRLTWLKPRSSCTRVWLSAVVKDWSTGGAWKFLKARGAMG